MDKQQNDLRKTLELIRNHEISPKEGFHAIQELRKAHPTGNVLYYRNAWEPSVLSSPATDRIGNETVLVFAAKEKPTAGLPDQHVAWVKPGPEFRAIGNLNFEINPAEQKDYEQLLQELNQQNFVPNQIVHAWSEEVFDFEESAIRAQLASSVYSLLHICQELMKRYPRHKMGLIYAYSNRDEMQPIYAAVSGFARSLRLEKPNFVCKTVEVSPAIGDDFLQMALQELNASDDVEVRYRNGVRFVQRLVECEREEETLTSLPLQNGGVYLITGGAGGLGWVFAEYLAQTVQNVKIVLTGRSVLDAEKQVQLKKWEQTGAEIVYERADVSKSGDVTRLMAFVKTRFGRLNGIMHSAGVLRDSFALKKTPEEMEAVLASKVYGTVHLESETKDEKLDFFVLFSSVASVVGNVGQVDYSYANRFLDQFATMMSSRKPTTKYLSLNWPLWKDGGMHLDEEIKTWLLQLGLVPMGRRNGIKALEDGLRSSLPQLLVVEGDARKIRAYLGTDAESLVHQEQEATEVSTEQKIRLREKTEAFLKEVLSKELELPQNRIDIKERLETYGINSIMIMGLTRELENHFGELSKTLFFEHQTITELAEYFIEEHTAKVMELVGETQRSSTAPQTQQTLGKKTTTRTSRIRPALPNSTSQAKEELLEDDIAIIGVSGRYPMARDLNELWENLKIGRDCITEIPRDRWSYQPDGNVDRGEAGKWGGFLEDMDKFDPLFFNISPKEAEMLDPQERLFLQTVWTTLEDSGYTREQLGQSAVGVFVGVMYAHYQLYGVEETMKGNEMALNSSFASIANRVSYFFNFHGPSIALDTMCSSSLTAIHLACESLRRGESEVAVAGGVNLSLHPNKYVALRTGKFLSSDGRCRAFGEGGDGYVPGEGVGAILLKPLKKAKTDGDRIYAVIKASALNHGGKTNGYTVPNPKAQGQLISTALKKANIDPRTISYVEAHGTGTSLGDPIELTGLMKAYRESNADTQFCAIGSVKSNIGHLESAAGIAGLTKILLQFKHKQLVPSIHAETLNPHIRFEESPFYVQLKQEEWKRPLIVTDGVAREYPHRAAISSFGAGGSNAHLILEEYESAPLQVDTITQEPQLILLSARNESRLREHAQQLADYLTQGEGMAVRLCDIAYTLQVGREPMEVRLALLVREKEELVQKLGAYLAGQQEIADTWQGDLEQNLKQVPLWQQDSEEIEYIRSVLRHGKLGKLAGMWTAGAAIDWRQLPTGSVPHRIALPTYPFEKIRFWAPTAPHGLEAAVAQRAVLQAGLHPLVDVNESTLEEELFRKTLRAQEYVIKDHVVSGQAILPGAAYMEMVRAAGELAAKRRVQEIRDVMWVKKIAVTGETQEVSIGLYPETEGVAYEVFIADGEERVIHSTGRLLFEVQATEEVRQPTKFDLGDIKRRCFVHRSKEATYRLYQKMGFDYGTAFQVTEEVFCGEREALAKLSLPEALCEDASAYQLHPSLLDGAFRATSGISNLLADSVLPYVPFALGRLEILRPLPGVCYAYATLADDSVSLKDAVVKFHITLLDESGEELVRIHDFSARPLQEQQTDGLFAYYPALEAAPLAEGDAVAPVGTILVFDDGNGQFSSRPHHSLQQIVVQPGHEYLALNPFHYYLDPANHEHYKQLIQDLQEKELQPTYILHLWNWKKRELDFVDLSDDNSMFERLSRELDNGVYSMTYLFQAITMQMPELWTRCLFVYSGDQEGHAPLQEALAGFANALTTVNHRFELVSLQVVPGSFETKSLPDLFLQELTDTSSTNGTEIRYDQAGRSIRVLKPYEEMTGQEVHLRQNGVYLLTGGAGGLGMIFARYLAETYNARLVLTGRSLQDDRIDRCLQELHDLGATGALYVQMDVANLEDVQGAVQATKDRFDTLNGIFHIAGIATKLLVTEQDRTEFERILLPKVHGTCNLDLATLDEKLDVFILFSSVAALVGDFGSCNYAFANRFLDGYAALREALRATGKRSGRTISINWPLWSGGGLELPEEEAALYFASTGMRVMDEQTGLRAFEEVLQTRLPQLAVARGDRQKIDRLLKVRERHVSNVHPEPEFEPVSASNAVADLDESLLEATESYLKELFSLAIKLPAKSINPHASLERYGIDSIMIMELNKLLEKDFPALPKTLLFEYRSVHDLAAYFVKHRGERMAELCGLQQQAISVKREVPTRAVREVAAASEPPRQTRFGQNRSQTSLPPAAKEDMVREEIAIIGLSGRYPMANNLDEFWENLKNGKDCISDIPLERWDYRHYFDPQKGKSGKMYSKWGGFLEHVDRFDPLFFNISPREAEMHDPQERLFLETAWQTVEDAGYARESLSGRRIGVFVGAMYAQYQMFGVGTNGDAPMPESFFSAIANRVSYVMNFNGPSLTVDTACSSALEAVRLGCENIWSGACEMAIAGGVNVSIHPNKYLFLSQSGFLSTDGRCRSFGAGGDGYVPGEGVGALLLKPLKQAVADGDHIYAVIKSISVNHGGKTNGYTVPNPTAQANLIADALKQSKLDARTISYIEAHGTGTALGDPIEIDGLTKAFQAFTSDKQYCALGSVKSNIGHLESAAGISSITKVLLQMKHKMLVPTLHSETLNPHIQLDDTPFYLQHEFTEWKKPVLVESGKENMYPRRAGISGFGAGGLNVHVVLEEYEEAQRTPATASDEPQIVVLSAKNVDRLKACAEQLAEFLAHPVAVKPRTLVDEHTTFEKMKNKIIEMISHLSKVEEKDIDCDENLVEYGYHTVNFAELSNIINAEYNVDINATVFSDYPTIHAIADLLCKKNRDKMGDATCKEIGQLTNERLNETFLLADLGYTLQTGREAMKERIALVVANVGELREKLLAYSQNAGYIDNFYTGSLQPALAEEEPLVGGAEGAAYVQNLLNGKKFNKIAKLWTQGVEIDWQLFHANRTPKRLSLPTYPFAGERYWTKHAMEPAPAAVVQAEVARLHPLIERNTSNLQITRFSTRFAGSEFFLIDDVHGEKALPQLTVLEMLRAAVEIAGEQQVSRIFDVEWAGASIPCQPQEELQVSLYQTADGVECELATGIGEAMTVYARASLAFANSLTDESRSPRIDVNSIKKRCNVRKSPTDREKLLLGNGLPVPAGRAVLEEWHHTDTEALALLRLPDELLALRTAFVLHPTVLDGVLQTLSSLLDQPSGCWFHSLSGLENYGSLPERCHVYVREEKNHGDERSFDVHLLDEAGTVVVLMRGLTVSFESVLDRISEQARDQELIEMLRKLQAGDEVGVEDIKHYMGVK